MDWKEEPWLNNSNTDHDNNDYIERCNSRFFLQSPHCPTNCLQHVRSSGQGEIMCTSRATYRVLITCNMLCASWYERTAQRLSLTEFKSRLFGFILLAETINRWKREETRVPGKKTPDDGLQKMPHTKTRKFKPQRRLKPTLSHWWRLGKQTH